MEDILNTRAIETSCLTVLCLPTAGQTNCSQGMRANWVPVQSASVISKALWLVISDISQLSPAPPQVHAITAPYAGSQALILSPGVLSPLSCRVGHHEATSGRVDTEKLPGGNSPYFIPCAAVACERVWWSEDKNHAGNRANILLIWNPPGLCPGPIYSLNQTWPKRPSFSQLCRENISLMHHRRQTLTLGM